VKENCQKEKCHYDWHIGNFNLKGAFVDKPVQSVPLIPEKVGRKTNAVNC
jgi:hypothetical protein